ncbi:unknown [Crocosphaera subtropica ATCC 51142]|uniref:DRTGG domain-containing protein n=1 Tax=Crocosphaera subtropica (strain ATCC 51142 / BH68) TaxID=43989 RepID=B1WRX9_CROS5|nr:phosphotransacetylase family protein [Crocosphaera subtropica]ACB50173.1 unknown [Crocosphaera subtropica ATCC 51142]
MAQSTKYLIVASIEAYTGKSGTILGLAHQFQDKGFSIAYSKPIGTCFQDQDPKTKEADVEFIADALGLKEAQIEWPLIPLQRTTLEKRLRQEDTTDYGQSLKDSLANIEANVVILEGAGTLWEGSLFGLSVVDMAKTLDASVLLVARYHSPLVVDSLVAVKLALGDRLVGMIINDIPSEELETAQTLIKPYLESHGVSVLGLLPASRLLRSVSVREIARQLKAQVLCRGDRLDLMVESLTIGAMNVNSALEYFRQGQNKAVVTGGDRTDLQLAALETSTSCLILTGHMNPQPLIITRAEDLEVPILSVDLDTLSTVEIVDQAFGKVRLQEKIKVSCIQELMVKNFDIDRLVQQLSL